MNKSTLKLRRDYETGKEVGFCYITYVSQEYLEREDLQFPNCKKHKGEWELILQAIGFETLAHSFHKTKEEALEAMRTQLLIHHPYNDMEMPTKDLIIIDDKGFKQEESTTDYITRWNTGKEETLSISSSGEWTIKK